jgi:bifunctional non-homologous end joining protein LigD
MSTEPVAQPAPKSPPLPEFVEPMLARPSRPFDSPDHLFELKWDGTRALTFVDSKGHYRMLNRRRRELGWRYPELSFVGDLPPGTVLDGEIVCFGPDGKPDFQALQAREQVRTEQRAARSVPACPATYIVFDQLYERFEPILQQRCDTRRQRLRELVASAAQPRLVMSEGVVGTGAAYFERAAADGLEGVIAKRLDSAYQAGKRTGAWLKIKRQETLACVVIGFVPEGEDDFGSLIVAAHDAAGELRCVGRVGSGFDAALRERINGYLYRHVRARPVIPSPDKGLWVEPGLYCTVRCMERTADGRLRAPVFGEVTHVRED